MKFSVDSETHAKNHKMAGLLGFAMSKSYTVINEFTLKISDDIFGYVPNYEDGCLILQYNDVYKNLLEKHSLHEKFLLQKPFFAKFHSELNPK